MRVSKAAASFIFITLNILVIRLISQIDLIFAARFGDQEVAAWGVASRFMIIDSIVILTYCPLISILVAKVKKEEGQAAKVAQMSQAGAVLIGTGLTALALVIYPFALDFLSVDSTVAGASLSAILWLSLTITLRILNGTSSMILFSYQKGQTVLKIKGLEIICNVLLNYAFAIEMGMGFTGIFISTFFSSLIVLPFYIKHTRAILDQKAFLFPTRQWLEKLTPLASFEFFRVASERVSTFLILFLIAQRAGFLPIYAVASELLLLLSLPLVGGMRALAIQLSGETSTKKVKLVSMFPKSFLTGVGLIVLVWAIIFLIQEKLFIELYSIVPSGLSELEAFIIVLGPILLTRLFVSLQRSVLFSRLRYKEVSIIDFTSNYLILLPIAYLGIAVDDLRLFWASFLVCELYCFLAQRRKL